MSKNSPVVAADYLLTVAMDPKTTNSGTNAMTSNKVKIGASGLVGLTLATIGLNGLRGNWTIFCSCFLDGSFGTDITTSLSPSLATVAADNNSQFCGGPVSAGYIWAVFTPTSGNGQAAVAVRA